MLSPDIFGALVDWTALRAGKLITAIPKVTADAITQDLICTPMANAAQFIPDLAESGR